MATLSLAIAALVAAASPAPKPAAAAPAAPATGHEVSAAQAEPRLAAAYYDPRYKVVVVPYTGAVPTYTQGAVDNPPRVFLDFQARFKGGYPAGTVQDHPSLLKWVMAPRSANSTRLTLTFREPTKLRVLHNARRHLLVLMPLANAAKPSPAPSASPSAKPSAAPTATPSAAPALAPRAGATTLGAPHYDAARRALVVPFQGAVPAVVTESLTNPARVYFDFEAAYLLRNMPAAYVTGHPTLVRWTLAPRDRDTTRVTLTFTQPVRVRLQPDEARHELLLFPEGAAVMGSPAPTPTPKATPAPTPTPKPTAKPTAAPALEPPRLTPSAKPTPIDSPNG